MVEYASSSSKKPVLTELWKTLLISKLLGVLSSIVLPLCVSLEIFGIHLVNFGFLQNSLSWIHCEYGRILLLHAQTRRLTNGCTIALCLAIIFCSIPVLGVSYWSSVPYKTPVFVSSIMYIMASLLDCFRETFDVKLCKDKGVDQKIQLERRLQLIEQITLLVPTVFVSLAYKSPANVTFVVLSGLRRLVSSSYGLWQVRKLVSNQFALDPSRLADLSTFWSTKEMRNLAVSEGWISLQKYIVSECDKILMIRVLSYEQRGAIAAACNVTNIVVRSLFKPTEQVIRSIYGSMRGNIAEPAQMAEFRAATKVQVSVACVLGTVGSLCATVFLQILRRSRYNIFEDVALRYECLCLIPMGIAGLTDGLLHVAAEARYYALIQKICSLAWFIKCVILLSLYSRGRRDLLRIFCLLSLLLLLLRVVVSVGCLWFAFFKRSEHARSDSVKYVLMTTFDVLAIHSVGASLLTLLAAPRLQIWAGNVPVSNLIEKLVSSQELYICIGGGILWLICVAGLQLRFFVQNAEKRKA